MSIHLVTSDEPAGERAWQLEHYRTYLEATPNRRKRTYAPRAIQTYTAAAAAFDKWLSARHFAGGFELVTVEQVNAYFSEYAKRNSDSGAATRQMDLRSLFNMLVREGFLPAEAHPYKSPKLNSYALADPRTNVSTLPDELLEALLRVTRGHAYLDVRDHAIIRLFLTGVRREEMARLNVEDVDMRNRLISTIRLKGNDGRQVPFGAKTALALSRWLRTRTTNTGYAANSTEGPLWLGDRNRPRLAANGIYLALRRRAQQAGYPKDSVKPHMFRHTASHGHLKDGRSEGDVMRLMGWKSRSMVDRYAAHVAHERAIEAARSAAWDDRWG